MYDAIETSADPIRMETVTRSIRKHPSTMHVTRDGTVDWRYLPYTDDLTFQPDNVVYGENGEILSPIDEFNTAYGGIFCGSGDFDIPSAGIPVDVFPYDQCVSVDLITALVEVFFDLTPEQVVLPLPESLKAQTTASRIGPLPTRLASGETVAQDLFVGFFPGEPVYSFGEQWRRRVEAELGLPDAMMIGYSQDHEGYLLIPEDWLLGGYEPDIGIYGPLEAEHVMEGVLSYSADLLLTTDVREDPDPLGVFGPTEYPEEAPSTLRPDPTPDAGTRIEVPPAYLWTPFLADGETGPSADDLVIPAQVPRVQGLVQLAWEGGDPMVDSPKVVLERQEGGSWVPVVTPAGRVIDEGRHDILLGHTPTPLAPAAGPQTHAWWAGWQVVGHWTDRTSVPLGTYRLHVTGRRWSGAGEAWPWEGVPYEVTSEAFEVVPGELTVTEDAAGLIVSLRAPADGYRFVAQGGDEDGDNPVAGPVEVEIVRADGTATVSVDPAPIDTRSSLGVTLGDWVSVRVTDAHGNTGVFDRP